MKHITTLTVIATFTFATVAALAADDSKTKSDTPKPAAKKPAPAKPAKKKANPDASLDELLNIPGKKKPGPNKKPDTPKINKPDKDIKIKENIGETFSEAVKEMKIAGNRLTDDKDTGLDTQRVQKNVISKLDQLIDQYRKQQSGGKGKPQSGQDQDTGTQGSQSKGSQPGPATGQGTEAAQNAGSSGSVQHGDKGDRPEATGEEEWGNLPPHIRKELLQGRTSKFSQLYKRLTEKYYKRLADLKKN